MRSTKKHRAGPALLTFIHSYIQMIGLRSRRGSSEAAEIAVRRDKEGFNEEKRARLMVAGDEDSCRALVVTD